MSESETIWAITRDGTSGTLAADATGIRLDDPTGSFAYEWAHISHVTFPTPYSVLVRLDDGDTVIPLGFASTTHAREFRAALEPLRAAARGAGTTLDEFPVHSESASHIPLLTIPTFPGVAIAEVLGIVTSTSVMSRNVFSDAGSDLMSMFGGNLGGMEKAIGWAVANAEDKLRRAALGLGADAVVGVMIGIAPVADKAQAILMSGTAIKMAESEVAASD